MRVLLVEWQFSLEQPAAIGARESRQDDRGAVPVARRADTGEPWIPPTSLAGSLRDHLGEDANLCDMLLGPDFPETSSEDAGPETARSSALRILGSAVDLGGETTQTRHRTAHDRHRAAARTSHLLRQEVLPRGTVVTLWAYLRDDHPSVVSLDELSELLKTATAGDEPWAPVIGGGWTVGRGKATLKRYRRDTLDLSVFDDLAWWLGGVTPVTIDERLSGSSARALKLEAFEHVAPLATWRFAIPDALSVTGGDSTLVRDRDGFPLIPGSTWKGVLRSRVEYILRSLGVAVCEAGNGAGKDACAGCPACDIFGGSGQRAGEAGTGLRSSLTFDDQRICTEQGLPAPVTSRTHVAIDRFTGGSATGLLRSLETVTAGTVALAVRPTTPSTAVPEYALPLIALAVRDITDGLIGVGHATTRGYGTLVTTDPLDVAIDWDRWKSELLPALKRDFPVALGASSGR